MANFSECMAWQAATDTWAIGNREIRPDFQAVTILHREALLSITNMVNE